jgi:hypothetical protein
LKSAGHCISFSKSSFNKSEDIAVLGELLKSSAFAFLKFSFHSSEKGFRFFPNLDNPIFILIA